MGLSDEIDTKSPESSYSCQTPFRWLPNGCHDKGIYGCELTHNCIQKSQSHYFPVNVVGLPVKYLIIHTSIHHERVREAVSWMIRWYRQGVIQGHILSWVIESCPSHTEVVVIFNGAYICQVVFKSGELVKSCINTNESKVYKWFVELLKCENIHYHPLLDQKTK